MSAAEDSQTFRGQLKTEAREAAVQILRGNAEKAARAWGTAIGNAADKGDHRPAKDLLLAVGAIPRRQTNQSLTDHRNSCNYTFQAVDMSHLHRVASDAFPEQGHETGLPSVRHNQQSRARNDESQSRNYRCDIWLTRRNAVGRSLWIK
jgi:hypothetical protein